MADHLESLRKGLRAINFQGLQQVQTFKSPNYKVKPALPDHRRTLYWNPDVYTDSDGNTQYVTIFKGRWMVFEFPRPFTFRLQVVQRWFNAEKKDKKDKELKRKIKRIETESVTFNKKCKVYAEDDFEAYYILDPNFINQIENLSEATNGKLMLCFIDNKLHVAIYDNKDVFEAPSVFKVIDEQAETEKINHEIKTITDYVDYLKLDRKLFTGNQQ